MKDLIVFSAAYCLGYWGVGLTWALVASLFGIDAKKFLVYLGDVFLGHFSVAVFIYSVLMWTAMWLTN
jgi:hypothetical protein